MASLLCPFQPGPPHHWLFGHIPAFLSIVNSNPPNLIFLAYHELIARKYNLKEPLYYLDLWPFAPASAVIRNGDVASQLTQTRVLPKDALPMRFVGGFMGELGLGPRLDGDAKHESDVNGKSGYHKFWRSIFNPGFSAAHMQTLTPLVVDKVLIFTAKLASYAKSGEIVSLETLTARLTVDIMAMLTVHNDFNTQSGVPHPIVEAMVKLPYYAHPIDSMNPFWIYSPYRKLMHMYYTNKTDQMIGKIIDERYAERTALKNNTGQAEKGRSREVLDLAYNAYEHEMNLKLDAKRSMDPMFRKIAIHNIRGFLFAG